MAKKRFSDAWIDERKLIDTKCKTCGHQLKECVPYRDEDVYDDYGTIVVKKTPRENRAYSCPGCTPRFVEFMKSYCLDAWKKGR